MNTFLLQRVKCPYMCVYLYSMKCILATVTKLSYQSTTERMNKKIKTVTFQTRGSITNKYSFTKELLPQFLLLFENFLLSPFSKQFRKAKWMEMGDEDERSRRIIKHLYWMKLLGLSSGRRCGGGGGLPSKRGMRQVIQRDVDRSSAILLHLHYTRHGNVAAVWFTNGANHRSYRDRISQFHRHLSWPWFPSKSFSSCVSTESKDSY